MSASKEFFRWLNNLRSWLPLLYCSSGKKNLVSAIRGIPVTDSLPIQPFAAGSVHIRPQNTVREAAEKLEATFLAEMLKSAGVGAQSHAFSGGIGEDQFASFQREALAAEMVKRGGIGLAETFYNALKEKADDQSNAATTD